MCVLKCARATHNVIFNAKITGIDVPKHSNQIKQNQPSALTSIPFRFWHLTSIRTEIEHSKWHIATDNNTTNAIHFNRDLQNIYKLRKYNKQTKIYTLI